MPEAAAPAVEPEKTTIAQAQALLDPLPEPNPAAIAAQEKRVEAAEPPPEPPAGSPPPAPAPAKPTPKPASKPAPVDADGKPFDPMIHEATPDGKPIFRSDGVTLRKRRTPLKAWKATSSVQIDDPATLDAEPSPEDVQASEAELLGGAATAAGLQILMMRAALGPKLVDEEGQREMLVDSWVKVFRHYGIGAVHPLVGLGLVTGGLVMAALKHEETQSRFRRFTNWMQHRMLSIWQWMTGRRKAKPEANSEAAKTAE